MGDAPDALALGAERERDLDAVGGQRAAGTVRPFHDDHGAGNIVDAELGELVGGGHPVEVDMDKGKSGQIVGLHQGESRTRHFDRGVAGKMGDHRAHQRRLARA